MATRRFQTRWPTRILAVWTLVAVAAAAPRARADEPSTDASDSADSADSTDSEAAAAQPPPAARARTHARTAMRPGALPALAALVPGLTVHGAGQFIGGDRRAGRRLLVAEGIALAAVATGAVPIALSGASRRVTPVALPPVVAGGGMFLLGWLADIYGAAGGPRLAGTAPPVVPRVEARLGYLHVHEPRFAFASFVEMEALLRAGAWHLEAATALAVDDDNQRVRAEVGHRVSGPRTTGRAVDGTALDLVAAVTRHRYGSDGFTTVTAEAAARGRLDLARISPGLAGGFVEMELGTGVDVATYRQGSADTGIILVSRSGFGVYLDRPGPGEIQIFYDHRRDGLVGGLPTRRFDGIAGSVGFEGVVTIARGMGLALRAQAGSAYLLGIGVRYTRP
jgi:hypothetical protein